MKTIKVRRLSPKESWGTRYQRMIDEATEAAWQILMQDPSAGVSLAFTPATDDGAWGQFHVMTRGEDLPDDAELVCVISPALEWYQMRRVIESYTGRIPVLGSDED